MFRDLLWLLHSKQSHDMQVSNGLGGFVALVAVFVLMFKWNDWFAPIFFGLGLDKLPALLNADHGEFYAMTFIHMLAWFFLIVISIGILMVLGTVLFYPLIFIIFSLAVVPILIGMVILDFFKAPFKKKSIPPATLDPARSRVARRSRR